jgi:hypothetical protein
VDRGRSLACSIEPPAAHRAFEASNKCSTERARARRTNAPRSGSAFVESPERRRRRPRPGSGGMDCFASRAPHSRRRAGVLHRHHRTAVDGSDDPTKERCARGSRATHSGAGDRSPSVLGVMPATRSVTISANSSWWWQLASGTSLPGRSMRTLQSASSPAAVRGARREAVHTAAPYGRGVVVADVRVVLQRKIQNA